MYKSFTDYFLFDPKLIINKYRISVGLYGQ